MGGDALLVPCSRQDGPEMYVLVVAFMAEFQDRAKWVKVWWEALHLCTEQRRYTGATWHIASRRR